MMSLLFCTQSDDMEPHSLTDLLRWIKSDSFLLINCAQAIYEIIEQQKIGQKTVTAGCAGCSGVWDKFSVISLINWLAMIWSRVSGWTPSLISVIILGWGVTPSQPTQRSDILRLLSCHLYDLISWLFQLVPCRLY